MLISIPLLSSTTPPHLKSDHFTSQPMTSQPSTQAPRVHLAEKCEQDLQE